MSVSTNQRSVLIVSTNQRSVSTYPYLVVTLNTDDIKQDDDLESNSQEEGEEVVAKEA